MDCIKCGAPLPAGALFCPACGKRQTPKRRSRRTRGNGMGSVYQEKNKTWTVAITLGYDTEDGKLIRKTRKKCGFPTKREAAEYIPQLRAQPANLPKDITFKALYEKWKASHENKVSHSTMNCYAAAYKHYEPIWYCKMGELRTAALQECVSAQNGKRTQQNMKALGTMLWRYAAKDDLVDKNYAELLDVSGATQEPREPFTQEELDTMWAKLPEVPDLDQVLILCYTGFRLDEFLSLKGADLHKEITDGQEWWYFVGGEKTEAGKNRLVALSPKIVPLVLPYRKVGYLFSQNGQKVNAKAFRARYYAALEAAGLPRRTPHCCRHTYATLMKNVDTVSDRDKMASIGHTSMTMTNHYTHADKNSQKKLAESL